MSLVMMCISNLGNLLFTPEKLTICGHGKDPKVSEQVTHFHFPPYTVRDDPVTLPSANPSLASTVTTLPRAIIPPRGVLTVRSSSTSYCRGIFYQIVNFFLYFSAFCSCQIKMSVKSLTNPKSPALNCEHFFSAETLLLICMHAVIGMQLKRSPGCYGLLLSSKQTSKLQLERFFLQAVFMSIGKLIITASQQTSGYNEKISSWFIKLSKHVDFGNI